MPASDRAEIVSTAFSVLVTLAVGLRALSRFVYLKRAWVDDYLIIFAALLSWTLTALIIAQGQHGLGQHYKDLARGEFQEMQKPFFASIPVYNLALTITKLSVLVQFLRFFVTPITRKLSWVLVGVVASYGTATCLVSLCSCRPVAYFWDKSIEGGKCIDLLAFWYTNATFNIITDIAVVALPVHALKDLHLPRRQKWALTAIFALGGFSCVTSILRLQSIYVVANSKDITWDNVDAAMWSAIELNTAIVCSCLPALKPLVQRFAPSWLLLSVGTDVGASKVASASKLGTIRKTMIVSVETVASSEASSRVTNTV